MRVYSSLFRQYKDQPMSSVFAHFYPVNNDYDEPFKQIAKNTWDGFDAWRFHQKRFIDKYPHSQVPKLKNYLNYTFVRLVELEQSSFGRHFLYSLDKTRICFNTGLQNQHQSVSLSR
jgi:hypothetical protein